MRHIETLGEEVAQRGTEVQLVCPLRDAVVLVGVEARLEEDVPPDELAHQHYRVLEVDIVVGRAMDQQEAFPVDVRDPSYERGPLVTLVYLVTILCR